MTTATAAAHNEWRNTSAIAGHGSTASWDGDTSDDAEGSHGADGHPRDCCSSRAFKVVHDPDSSLVRYDHSNVVVMEPYTDASLATLTTTASRSSHDYVVDNGVIPRQDMKACARIAVPRTSWTLPSR